MICMSKIWKKASDLVKFTHAHTKKLPLGDLNMKSNTNSGSLILEEQLIQEHWGDQLLNWQFVQTVFFFLPPRSGHISEVL